MWWPRYKLNCKAGLIVLVYFAEDFQKLKFVPLLSLIGTTSRRTEMHWPKKLFSWYVTLSESSNGKVHCSPTHRLLLYPLKTLKVARNETMSERLAKLETLEKEHTALESRWGLKEESAEALHWRQLNLASCSQPDRYQHMLVMYGEKAEEAQELKLDLEDVRATYQLQIQQLAARLEELK